jgi:hypothetical protein
MDHDPRGEVMDQVPVLLLARAQLFFGALALGDVLVEGEDERLAAEVDHAGGDGEGEAVSILMVMLDFKTDDFPGLEAAKDVSAVGQRPVAEHIQRLDVRVLKLLHLVAVHRGKSPVDLG